MRPEMSSKRFEISKFFEKSFRLHGNFTASNLEILSHFQKLFRLHGNLTVATSQTIARLVGHVQLYLLINKNLIDAK